MADFHSHKEFDNWLSDKPRDWAVVLAARTALRVLPILARARQVEDFGSVIVLPVVRAMALAWAAATYPAQARELADRAAAASEAAANATAAADAADSAANAAYAYAAHDAARAAADAYASAADTDAYVYSAYAAADAATDAAATDADAAIWDTLQLDGTRLENGAKAAELARSPLWAGMNDRMFDEQRDALRQVLSQLGGDWPIWQFWYHSRFDGQQSFGLPASAAEAIDLRIARQDDDWWKRGPEAVNAEIAGWVKEIRESADFEPMVSIARFVVGYLEKLGAEATHAQITEAYRRAGGAAASRSVRGELGRLSSAGKIERVQPGHYRAVQKADQLAATLAQYSVSIPTGSAVVTVGSKFALELKSTATDESIAKRIAENGRKKAAERKASRLADAAKLRLGNYGVWNDLIDALSDTSEWLALPAPDMAKRIGVAWENSVTIGSFIELDDQLRLSRDSIHQPLDDDLRRSLVDVNASLGTLVREFPSGQEMDNRHREWIAKSEAVEVSKAILANVKQTHILLEEFVPLIDRALRAANPDTTQAKKSGAWGVGTIKKIGLASLVAGGSLLGTVAGDVVGGVGGEVGAEIARESGLSRTAAELVVHSKAELIELVSDEPADIRYAVEELIRRVEQAQSASKLEPDS